MKLLRNLAVSILVIGTILTSTLPVAAAADKENPQTPKVDRETPQTSKIDRETPPAPKADKDKETPPPPKTANVTPQVPKVDKEIPPAPKTEIVRGLIKAKTVNSITVVKRVIPVSKETKFQIPGVKNATLADIKINMYVVARIVTEDGKRFTSQVEVIPGLSIASYVGNVTAFSYVPTKGGSISIAMKGKTETFKIGGNLTVRPIGATVKAGDVVTVVARGNQALRVVIHPKPQQITGIVTAINTTGTTITVGAAVIKYNAKTLFVLLGAPGLQVGQTVNATCYQQADGSLLATRVQKK